MNRKIITHNLKPFWYKVDGPTQTSSSSTASWAHRCGIKKLWKLLIIWTFLIQCDLMFVQRINYVYGEFENSWTFYFEQPCCSNGGHHFRHHRGKQSIIYFQLYYKSYRLLPKLTSASKLL